MSPPTNRLRLLSSKSLFSSLVLQTSSMATPSPQGQTRFQGYYSRPDIGPSYDGSSTHAHFCRGCGKPPYREDARMLEATAPVLEFRESCGPRDGPSLTKCSRKHVRETINEAPGGSDPALLTDNQGNVSYPSRLETICRQWRVDGCCSQS